MANTNDAEWMTVAEVAAAFRLDPETVRLWVRRGLLAAEVRPDARPGPTYRIRRADVRAFAEQYDRGTPRPAPGLLTLAEVAARVGVGYETVRAWVARGLIPVAARDGPFRRPRQWVRWSDVRLFGELHYRGKPRPAWLDEPDA